MLVVEGEVKIGSLTASTTPSHEARQLLGLLGELAMGGAGGRCVVDLADGSLEAPSAGQPVTVSLGTGQGLTPVFTGEVLSVSRTPAFLRITAADAVVKLARFDVEAFYEGKTAGDIVRDVLGQAGCDAGTLSDGPTLGFYALHRGPRALRHLQRLAELCGADLFTDGDGRVCFTTADEQGSEHSFRFGQDILDFHLEAAPPAFDSASVWGEGAASAQGAGKEHWLVKDLTSVNGKAAVSETGTVSPGQEGKAPLLVVEGALRSGDAARTVAQARMASVASRAVRGFLEVLGTPGIHPGDTITLQDVPGDDPARQPLRVRRVRHRLDSHGGFITRMDF